MTYLGLVSCPILILAWENLIISQRQKKPAQCTQRRKNDFEEQTAKRQIEYMAIRFAHEYLNPDPPAPRQQKEKENKSFCIEYIHEHKKLFYRDRTKKRRECKWLDSSFQKQLIDECFLAVLSQNLESPIIFFTQHNRQGIIFHANPEYKANDPWYDWAYVDWGESTVPSKMLLFMEIERCEFKKPFRFGKGYIQSAGSYAISYTFAYNDVVPAHGITKMCDYGRLLTETVPILGTVPQLWVFDVDSIAGPCTAVPYNNDSHQVRDLKWIILKPKNDWYKVFVDLMRESIGSSTRNNN